MIIIGHRGAAGLAPENTVKSVRKAVSCSVDMIEIDVYLSDGSLVVFHDDKVNRTTNGKGKLDSYSFDELRKLDAGDGEHIPTLTEVFDAVPNYIFINVELKGEGTEKHIKEFLTGYPEFNVIVSSFDREKLNYLKNSKLNLALITDTPLMEVPDWYYSIHVSYENLTKEFVELYHEYGLRVFAYTVNDEKDAMKMLDWKVDGIFTDFPDKFI